MVIYVKFKELVCSWKMSVFKLLCFVFDEFV